MNAMHSPKARASIVYVVHDVIKMVRANCPQKDRNAKMRESALVLSLEKILFQLTQRMKGDMKHNVRMIVATCVCQMLGLVIRVIACFHIAQCSSGVRVLDKVGDAVLGASSR